LDFVFYNLLLLFIALHVTLHVRSMYGMQLKTCLLSCLQF